VFAGHANCTKENAAPVTDAIPASVPTTA